MTKKKVPPAEIERLPETEISSTTEVVEAEAPPTNSGMNLLLIDQAIAEGVALINAGNPKIEAAMLIYAKLESEPQEVVVDAFIKGASLTPKGALTYWYNCRRKLRKQRLSAKQ